MTTTWAGKTPTADEWRDILEKHARWLRGQEGGTRADLTGADLTDAVLTGAVLTGAVLTGAVLTRAVLTRADLTRADLTRAVLTGADLTDAVLTGAVLTGAVLTRAVLTGADLTWIRDDLWAVLSASPAEVPALRAAVAEGRINGSAYEGECACLVGTLAKARGVVFTAIPGLRPNCSRPAERFFMAIKKGDRPETSQAVKLTLDWIDEWLSNVRGAFGALAGAASPGEFASHSDVEVPEA